MRIDFIIVLAAVLTSYFLLNLFGGLLRVFFVADVLLILIITIELNERGGKNAKTKERRE